MTEENKKNAENETEKNDGSVVASGIHYLSIIGQIEGHFVLDQTQKATKYEHIIPIIQSVYPFISISGTASPFFSTASRAVR